VLHQALCALRGQHIGLLSHTDVPATAMQESLEATSPHLIEVPSVVWQINLPLEHHSDRHPQMILLVLPVYVHALLAHPQTKSQLAGLKPPSWLKGGQETRRRSYLGFSRSSVSF
jgi:hypothetical protein